ncbi:MAG: sigma-54 dependent transcriptional regulator, partial [Acidobacteriota bacterium]
QLAIGCASKSGHSRTELCGYINLSHALQTVGEWDEARKAIDLVLRRSVEDVELKVAALDSLVNLFIAERRLGECGEIMRQIDEIVAQMPTQLYSHWTNATISHTRIRLLQAQDDWAAADTELVKALNVAAQKKDFSWEGRLRLLRLKGLVATKKFAEASQLLASLELRSPTVSALAQQTGILGMAAVACGRVRAGQEQLRRAQRISSALGDAIGGDDLAGVRAALRLSPTPPTLAATMNAEHDPDTPPAPDLDTAVSLLELGGHAHILGREALAVLEAAGCTRGAALVARTANGVRVIEARGWDERQALAAARQPDNHDVIAVGEHRDEPWQLVAEPRPELEHRCALIAIRKLIDTALTLDRFRREEKQRAALWPSEALDGNPESIWASEEMSELMSVARKIAPTPLSILLTGETGTGKEMLARVIHRASDRADRPLLPFNCTAVPRDMLESQLFGYRKGAFTGADTAFPGVIRSAAGGTLFLDEIAEVGIDVQPKLLRFLETHEIHPLGEPHPITVDVRVIAATNARLEQLVAEGRFREDLFYRLNIVRLRLPPLRERREEIPALVEHYLRKYRDELKKGRLTLSDETLEYLLLYAWPGNIRQLANEVRRMVAMAEPDSALTPTLLSPEIQASRRTIPAVAPLAAATTTDPEVRVRIDQPMPVAVQLLEQTMVRNALDRAHGRVEQAARLLGISRKGLFLKRRRWGLQHHRDS